MEKILHSRRLAGIWQRTLISDNKRKAHAFPEGERVATALFGLHAYSTRNEVSPRVILAQKASEKLTDAIRDTRDEINALLSPVRQRPFDAVTDFEPNHSFTLAYPEQQICPPNAMLIRLFLSADAAWTDTNRYWHNGESSKARRNELQKAISTAVIALLVQLYQSCKNYHLIRKQKWDHANAHS